MNSFWKNHAATQRQFESLADYQIHKKSHCGIHSCKWKSDNSNTYFQTIKSAFTCTLQSQITSEQFYQTVLSLNRIEIHNFSSIFRSDFGNFYMTTSRGSKLGKLTNNNVWLKRSM